MAEIDARLDERMGSAKVRRLRALLEEMGDALPPPRCGAGGHPGDA